MREKVILVPTDFSKNADVAVRFAVGLACDLNARLIVLHAYRLVQTLKSANQSAFSIKKEWDKTTNEQFARLENEILADCNLKLSFESEVGFADDAIISSVKSNKVDLVVMGTSGEGVWRGVFGSTTIKTINKAACPVIVVPPGVNYAGLDLITFAYDFKKIREFSIFILLKDLIKRFNANLEVLNINRKEVVAEGGDDVKTSLLDRELEGLDHNYSFIKNETVPEGILSHITEKSTDLLVLLKRDHTMYEKLFNASVTREMVLHSDLPLMVLRE